MDPLKGKSNCFEVGFIFQDPSLRKLPQVKLFVLDLMDSLWKFALMYSTCICELTLFLGMCLQLWIIMTRVWSAKGFIGY